MLRHAVLVVALFGCKGMGHLGSGLGHVASGIGKGIAHAAPAVAKSVGTVAATTAKGVGSVAKGAGTVGKGMGTAVRGVAQAGSLAVRVGEPVAEALLDAAVPDVVFVEQPVMTPPIYDPCLECALDATCDQCTGYGGYACEVAPAGARGRCESTAPADVDPLPEQ
jgi:hypothetical protein